MTNQVALPPIQLTQLIIAIKNETTQASGSFLKNLLKWNYFVTNRLSQLLIPIGIKEYSGTNKAYLDLINL